MSTLARPTYLRVTTLIAALLLIGGTLLAPAGAAASSSGSQAASVVNQLQSYLEGVRLLADLTPRTDPERLLGVPGEYTSRAVFTDTWLSSDGQINGIVEVFDLPTDLRRRQRTMTPAQGEVDLVSGTILVRLFGIPAAYADSYNVVLQEYVALY